MPERIRWRQTPHDGDPAQVEALVTSTGVFTSEEAAVAAELVTTTLDGTESYRFVFVEDATGALIGYTCFDRVPLSSVAFDLYWIVVAPNLRGTGLAAELMQRTATVAKKRHGTQIFAETSSREPYAPARAFYRKAGFEEAARFEDFYAAGDDKLIFRMKL